MIVGVGAFERDNFGDLLYAELARKIAGNRFDLTLATPIAADMRPDIGIQLPAIGEVVQQTEPDGFWVIGGEVGATSADYVYGARFGTAALNALHAMSAVDREAHLRASGGGILYAAPYIPRPSLLDNTQDTALVLSSVGLAGIRGLPSARVDEIAATLREASYVSVRDHQSGQVMEWLGVEHVVAPDFAHCIGALYSPSPLDSEYILVQVPEAAFSSHDREIWIKAILEVASIVQLEVRLFLAGTAPGHDSITTAHVLAEACLSAGLHATVSTARSVFPRIDEIAGASLWVGGSLHGRIIAQTYGVPRVSFTKSKVNTYAAEWDAIMPYGVGPSGLGSGVQAALETRDAVASSESLTRAAIESTERAIDMLSEGRRNEPRSSDSDL